jgi:CubicO group peptidase (beta-lactamase class C family)
LKREPGVACFSVTKKVYELGTYHLLQNVKTESKYGRLTKEATYQSLCSCSSSDISRIVRDSKLPDETLFEIADRIEQDDRNIKLAHAVREACRPFHLESAIGHICDHLTAHCINKESAAQMAAALRKNFSNGNYERIFDVDDFALAVTQDLQEVSHNRHVYVMAKPPTSAPKRTDAERAKELHESNFGIATLSTPAGGTAYIDIRAFENPKEVVGQKPVVRDFAMNALKQLVDSKPKEVVIDLRNHGGGSVYMTQLFLSHFLEEGLPLTRFEYKESLTSDELYSFPLEPLQTWSYDQLPKDRRLLDVSIYVLVSHDTFSAGEDFACHLKERDRATLIGQATGGGADPNKLYDANEFQVAMPFAFARVPYGPSWEGVGVVPHVQVGAGQDARAVVDKYTKVTQQIHPSLGPVEQVARVVSIEEQMSSYSIPGVRIAVIDNFQLSWSQGFGEMKEANMRIQAASVSKSIAAMAVLSLVGEKGLDDDVGVAFKAKAQELWSTINPKQFPVTVRQLLSHTAGVQLGSGQSGFDGYEQGDKIPTLDEILLGNDQGDRRHVHTGAVRIVREPGKEFGYQGGGPTILQKWVEISQNKSFPEVVQERVFGPLEMNRSGYLATKGPPGGARIYPEFAAAGASSTPEDLAKMVIEIQKAYHGQGKVLSQETAQEMLKPKSGLGVAVPPVKGTRYFFHTGENQGFRCIIVGNTDGQGAVIMTNSNNGTPLYREVLTRIAEVYGWKDADQVDVLEPLMDVEEAKKVDREAWAAQAVGVYRDRMAPPDEKVTLRVFRGENKEILGQIVVEKGGTVLPEAPFEIHPISSARACFKRGGKVPYEYLDVGRNKSGEQAVIFSFGGDFIKLSNAK